MKKNLSIILVCMCMALSVVAQTTPITMNIWEGKAPTSNGKGADDEIPTIQVFLPQADKANGEAIVICPGGGYVSRAMDHEGLGWAPFFNERGIACIIVAYRLPYGHDDVPLSDVVQAMRIVRKNATAWNINPDMIGVMGSSAGGHLASTLSGHAPVDARPNFQILFYPVITMDKSYTHGGSRTNLIGENSSKELENLYSNEFQVRVWTPKTILILADNDNVVPVQNSVNYYLALKKANIPASMYIYPSGGHGFGSSKNYKYYNAMINDLSDWLLTLFPKEK